MKRVTYGLAIALGVGVGAWLGYWFSDHDDPVIISKIDVVTPHVPPGGELKLRVHIYRLRNDCSYVETRSFIGADLVIRNYVLEEQRQGQLLGAAPPEERSIRIPLGMPPGPAEYASTLSFSCGNNPLHGFNPIIIGPLRVMFTVNPE